MWIADIRPLLPSSLRALPRGHLLYDSSLEMHPGLLERPRQAFSNPYQQVFLEVLRKGLKIP
jgi:hypothetical protein